MKYVVVIAFLVLGCKKDAADGGAGTRLRFIKTAGKTYQSFEYNSNNLLVKEAWFGMCETTPADEFFYSYTGDRLDTITSVIRSLYSSTSFICDPTKGLRSYSVAAYDAQNRIAQFSRSMGDTRTYQYNAQGFIVQQIIRYSGSSNLTLTYTRDAAGNIIEATDGQGNTTRYEFDAKINPYYTIKKGTDVITAFNNSPNNVVKIISATGSSTISYKYNSQNLPVEMRDNGTVYQFVYQ